MVLLGASLTAFIGAGVLSDLQTSIYEQDAEQTIREVDSRLTEVALGDNLQHTLAFDASDKQNVRIAGDAKMNITLRGADNTCNFPIPLGSIHYETEDGSTVTYQGGGIWRTNPAGNNSMVSPPDMEYRDGTVTFPAVNINGSVNGSVEELRARKDLVHSRARSQDYAETMADCAGASNMTITVTSSYADAWGAYLERQVSENVTYDLGNSDPDDDSVTVRIVEGIEGGIGANDSEVVVEENTTVSVSVLGTGVSAEGCSRGSCVKYWTPVTLGILTDGDETRPWPDGPYDPSDPITIEQNLNDRATQLTEWTTEFQAEAGTTISLRAAMWNCEWWQDAGSDGYDHHYWEHYNCGELDNVNVRTDASSGENPENVRVLGDGDQMPVIETSHRQRNAEEVLGPLLNDTGHLDLAANQVVFLFELTEEDATWDEADEGSGDPDYNDAIALLEIEEQEGQETSGNDFQIRLSMNEVVIEPADG